MKIMRFMWVGILPPPIYGVYELRLHQSAESGQIGDSFPAEPGPERPGDDASEKHVESGGGL